MFFSWLASANSLEKTFFSLPWLALANASGEISFSVNPPRLFAVLSTGSDSPVKALSFVLKEWQEIILASAGTISPASSLIISPQTSSEASISISSPRRVTLAIGDESFFRLSSDLSALIDWTVPRTALRIRTRMITRELSALPVAKDMAAAIMRIMTSRSLN